MSGFSTLKSSLSTLYFVVIYLVLPKASLSSSKYLGENLYEACKPQSCGTVKNITYPFYINSQQPVSCGYYMLLCPDENTNPVLNLSEDNYTVQEIFYQNQSILITNSAFLDLNCSSFDSIHNFTVGDGDADDSFWSGTYMFGLPNNSSTVNLLINCSSGEEGWLNFTCEGNANGNKNRTIWATYRQDAGKDKNCTEVVSVPYRDGTSAPIEVVLRRGFFLNWKAENCSACQNSGGICGYNHNTSEVLCYCPEGSHSIKCHPGKTHLKVILASVLPGGILITAALVLVLLCFVKRSRLGSSRLPSGTVSDLDEHSLGFSMPLFSYHELEEATNNFEPGRVLGDGGYGTVYRGKIKDGREVAIKRLYENNCRRVEQFMNEVEILTRLRHQNLVTLYGCTSRHSRELLLVYEYVRNGTVADHLHGDRARPGSLPWPIRLSIATETASALVYLHASDVIHRDVKTYNILLDSNFSVKVADFGLSRLFPSDATHISTAPQGTPGYVDPEYHHCYQLTEKSDVYSFGVVLIELISSMPAVDLGRPRHEINLADYAVNRIQRCAFSELVDPHLGYDSDYKVRKTTALVAELAFQCLQQEKEFRPSMNEVLEVLKRIESADYEALRAEEKDINNEAADDDVLLKNVHHPPSPDTVMANWVSRSATPNTSK